nr:(Fe-S)-binding protein [Actinomycetota bacterium]
TLVEMTEPDTCCGFGGVFSFAYPEVSTRLADAKLGHAAATSARYVVSTDLACLMHLDGRRRRLGPATAPQPIHIADLLASGLPAASG